MATVNEVRLIIKDTIDITNPMSTTLIAPHI